MYMFIYGNILNGQFWAGIDDVLGYKVTKWTAANAVLYCPHCDGKPICSSEAAD